MYIHLKYFYFATYAQQLFFWILLLVLLTSCKIEGSFGGLYSCYKTTNKIHPDLIAASQPDQTICAVTHSDSAVVYPVNGLQIKNCIGQSDALVYIWKPNCSSSFCYSPTLLQARANAMHAELFIVAEYYDYDKMSVPYKLQRPIMGIDTKHYGSNLTSKYLSRFLKDLTGEKEAEGSLLYFKHGVYQGAYRSIDSLVGVHTVRL